MQSAADTFLPSSGSLRIEDHPHPQYCRVSSEYRFDGDTVESPNGWGVAVLRAFRQGLYASAIQVVCAGANRGALVRITIERNKDCDEVERTARMMARVASKLAETVYEGATCHEPVLVTSDEVCSLKAVISVCTEMRKDELFDEARARPGDRVFIFRLLESALRRMPGLSCLKVMTKILRQVPRAEVRLLLPTSDQGFTAVLPERYRGTCIAIAVQNHMAMVDQGRYGGRGL